MEHLHSFPPIKYVSLRLIKTHTGDAHPPQEASASPDVSTVAAPLPPEPPANFSTPTVHESTPPQGPSPIWETVPRPLTQIPLFYPPPSVESFQVAATLTLPNMVLAIPVWYLHPPEMVPCPQEGLPHGDSYSHPHHPHYPHTPHPSGYSWGQEEAEGAHLSRPPRIPPLCTLCEKEGHQTNNCPSLPELRNLFPLIPLHQHPSLLQVPLPPTLPVVKG
jgi:hypothetical protein